MRKLSRKKMMLYGIITPENLWGSNKKNIQHSVFIPPKIVALTGGSCYIVTSCQPEKMGHKRYRDDAGEFFTLNLGPRGDENLKFPVKI